MFSMTVKLKNGVPQNVTKQFLSWLLKKKRKFCTSKTEYYRNEENEEYEERYSTYQKKFGPRYDRYSNFNRHYRDPYKSKFTNRNLLTEVNINWNSINLKPFKSDFYTPHSDVLSRSPEEIQKFYKENELKIMGEDCPLPIFNFHELNLPENVLSYLSKLNYSKPTPIQSQTWPIALSGRNMVGISRTGSGKTLGYILPALIHIQNQPILEAHEGPIALILAPTRELVQQIQSVTFPIARACDVHVASLFGGVSKMRQMNEIMKRKEVYIATPGRLLDFLKDKVADLKRCTYLVLDEADQMLDMGFEPQIRGIISHIRPDRQVLMWSATWPREISNLANEFLRKYIKVQVGSAELSANPNITQIIHVCDESDKLKLLKEVLNEILKEEERKTIVFAQTKVCVEKIGRFLHMEGIASKTLHGDHSQNSRDFIMRSFREGSTNILIATNVAGRGIDVNDIRYVINFDFPPTVEEYVHKIGRTARSDSSGTAHTFFTQENASLAQELISVLETSHQPVSPELKEIAHSRYRPLNSRANRFGYTHRY